MWLTKQILGYYVCLGFNVRFVKHWESDFHMKSLFKKSPVYSLWRWAVKQFPIIPGGQLYKKCCKDNLHDKLSPYCSGLKPKYRQLIRTVQEFLGNSFWGSRSTPIGFPWVFSQHDITTTITTALHSLHTVISAQPPTPHRIARIQHFNMQKVQAA